jgi:hypothetical protein
VLGLLTASTPNRDIADRLVVTLDTVKRHVVRHIFDKLGAVNPRTPLDPVTAAPSPVPQMPPGGPPSCDQHQTSNPYGGPITTYDIEKERER